MEASELRGMDVRESCLCSPFPGESPQPLLIPSLSKPASGRNERLILLREVWLQWNLRNIYRGTPLQWPPLGNEFLSFIGGGLISGVTLYLVDLGLSELDFIEGCPHIRDGLYRGVSSHQGWPL